MAARDIERLVWQLAGQIGIDPRRLTLRRLLIMAHARNKQLWDHTCSLAAVLINCWSETKVDAQDLHPYAPPQEIITLNPKESMAYLKRIYGHA